MNDFSGGIALKIGFFDSGIVGVSVLYEALKMLPEEDYIYYADTKNVPYGTKPKDVVRGYVIEAAEFIASKGVKALVVACNTATSIAIEDLRKRFDFPIIGMEPAVKPAVERTGGGKRVLVTATPLTIKEDKLKNLIHRIDGENIVDLLPLPGLVQFAEKLQFDDDVVIPYLQEELSRCNGDEFGTIVMGCTHFSLFKDMYKKMFPNADVIDGSVGTVRNLKRILSEAGNLGGGSGKVEYYDSGESVVDEKGMQRFDALLKRLKEIDV
jgi:glutamate racemase